jgi:arsenite methyltransferase
MMSEGVMVAADVVVRPAFAADLSAVAALLTAVDLPAGDIEAQFEDGFVVAEQDGQVIGVAGLEVYGANGLLRSVAVAPAHRGRSVAAALVNDRVEWARARGLRGVYLLTTTASPYCEKSGFTAVERDVVPSSIRRSSEFSEVCPATATAMELRLEPRSSSCCGAPVLLSAAPATAAAVSPCCGPVTATPATTTSAAAVAAGPRGAQLGASFDSGDAEALKAQVRERYGEAATRASTGAAASCCGASPDEVWDPITADLYDDAETRGLPAEAMLASLGCGNPTALAQLHEGETVLDLGSGGGIDVLLSARRVGPTGHVYGLDMTDEMLELARANQARAGATNVEFLKGDIESIPLPDESVDVIISNCVINLAADKGSVLREAFRVLRPGGRFAVSDVVARRAVPAAVQRSMELWMGCVAGALQQEEYERLLEQAGFTDIGLEPTRVYGADDARFFLEGAQLPVPARLDDYDGAFMSAFVRAVKPA